jgi:glutathione S-transferase
MRPVEGPSEVRTMLIVHHLENSRSQRILWLLEELGVPYEVRRYERDKKTMLAPLALKLVHPLGKSPVITDDGVTVAESGAIVEYIVDRYGKGRMIPPTGTPERLRYTYWLHYAEGSLMPLLVMKLVLSRVPQAVPGLVRPIARRIVSGVEDLYLGPNLRLQLDYVESELSKSEWLAGKEITAADVQMSFPLEAAAARGDTDKPRPFLKAFLGRVHERPAYKRALEKGGPYELLR